MSTSPSKHPQMTDEELEAELRELEEFAGAIEEDPEKSFDDNKKTAFLNEINSISGLTNPSARATLQPVQVSYTPVSNKAVERLIERERKYHTISYFIGDALDAEIATHLPRLELELKKAPGNTELRELFEEKKKGLLRFKEKLEELRKSGQMSDATYLGALKKVLAANETLHQTLVGEKSDEESITRVWERVEKIRGEIRKYEPQGAGQSKQPSVVIEPSQAGPEPRPSAVTQPKTESKLVVPAVQKPSLAPPVEKSDNFFDMPEPSKPPVSIKPVQPEPRQPSQPPESKPPSHAGSSSHDRPPVPAVARQSVSTDKKKPPASNPPAPIDITVSTHISNNLVAHICYKLECRKSLRKYLETHFPEKRADDIKNLTNEVTKLEMIRDTAMNNPGKMTPEKIDAVFPEFTQIDVLGEPKKQMENNLKKISEVVAAESKQIKNAKIAEAFTAHYRNFFAEVNAVLATPNTPMPKIERQTIEVPCNDTNTHVRKGDLVIQLKKLVQTGEPNTFRVVVDFQYDNRPFQKDFRYNEKSGAFNREATFSLDRDKILKKFSKQNLYFSVFKKHMWSDELVGKGTVPLQKLERSLGMPWEFVLEWSGKKLTFSGEVHVNKALDQPMKEMKVFGIEKKYPPWVPPPKVGPVKQVDAGQTQPRPSVPPPPSSAQAPNRQSVQTKPATQPPPSNAPAPTQQKAPPAPAPAPAQQTPQAPQEFKSQFKFPLMSVATKNRLKAFLTQNKLDASTADYELSCFCVGFLEVLEGEAEKQAEVFMEEGDTDSRKAATDVMMKAIQYKKYIETSMDTGKMTLPDYIKKLEDFLKLEDAFLATLTKLKQAQGVYYVTNRRAAIQEELAMLKEQAG